MDSGAVSITLITTPSRTFDIALWTVNGSGIVRSFAGSGAFVTMTKGDCTTITIGRSFMPTWFRPIVFPEIKTIRQHQGSITVLPRTDESTPFGRTLLLIADTFPEPWMIKAAFV